MIYETFPEAPRTAYLIAQCESGLKMVQSNHMQPYGREESWGVFQIHSKAWDGVAKELGLDYINDVRDNIKMARYIYDQAGSFQPWTCYSKNMLAVR